MTGSAQLRSLRINELTRMALILSKYEEIKDRPYQMAERHTAEQYLAEVVRRVKSK